MTDAPAPVDDRTEWLAWRKLGIGASDVAALVGMSNYASPMSVWTDKLGLSGPDEDNDYMEYGRRAEPMLTGYFEDRTGLFVVAQQERAIHPDHPHHRATLDGLACEHPDGGPLGVVEYKTTGWGAWDEIPDAYAIQKAWIALKLNEGRKIIGHKIGTCCPWQIELVDTKAAVVGVCVP